MVSNLDKVVSDFMVLMRCMRNYYLRPAEQITRLRLSPGHFHTLSIIYHRGSFTMRELAAEIMISKQQLTPIVDRLVEAGMVIRKPDDKDRRMIRIELSDKGRDTYYEMGAKLKANFKDRLSQIPESQLEQLEEMLPLINKILGDAGSTRFQNPINS